MYRSSLIQISTILLILFALSQPDASYYLQSFYENSYIDCLRPLSSKIQGNDIGIVTDSAEKKASSAGDALPRDVLTDKNPQAYLSPQFTKSEWRDVLTKLGGPIVDISMEAILPELGIDALEGSKGGLGILEGGSGEGYSKVVWSGHVPGVKAFISMPMYEYKIVAKTDLDNKRQYLEGEKVQYDKIIDYDNPVDCTVFTDPNKFSFPELESNPSKPIKILVDGDKKQLSFKVKLYDEFSGVYRNFKVVVFVINRGGTPTFLMACQDVKHVLYPDDESARLNQQVLMGRVTPMLYKRLGIKPAIMRVNEAHTVIAMAEMMMDPYFSDTAFIFTNHTPITAGLQIYYGKAHWFSRLGIPEVFEDKSRNLKINFKDSFVDHDSNLNFSLAAMILPQLVNGVSNAHGITLQKMFPYFKDKIRAILNGTDEFWKSDNLVAEEINGTEITPSALWGIHQKDKEAMIELIKERTGCDLDVNTPTAVAIRRIDYYKQQYPMLKDIVKALCQDKGIKTTVLLDDEEVELEGLGMQVVVGGIIVNAHNPDLQYWIREFISWMQDPDFKGRFVFISGNDLELMKVVANGCDCWFEIPRRNPHTGDQEEACGTSGMRAAMCGNPPIMSSGMWGDEFIVQYDPETNQGNGFILEDITPRELYDSLSVISDIYYSFLDNGDTRFIDFRKRVYEDAKILYIENMTMRYISEMYLPARQCKKIEDSIKKTAKIAHLPGEKGSIELGDIMKISVTLTLDDPSMADGITAQIWTDIDSPGDWYAIGMDLSAPAKGKKPKTYEFTSVIRPNVTGDFYYKLRFIVNDNGRYIYMPKEYGNDIRITVNAPNPEQASRCKAIHDIDKLNREIGSAA